MTQGAIGEVLPGPNPAATRFVENGFRRYIALGDSISIDLYPALELAGSLTPAERGAGAASLFHRNRDDLHPEFRGCDLRTLLPSLQFRNAHDFSAPAVAESDNLTTDGATTLDVLEHQIRRVAPSTERTIVTLTAGGNDMLQMLGAVNPPRSLVAGMVARFHRILREVRGRLPESIVVAGTVYDPSDGTNELHGQLFEREASWLATYNDAVRDAARWNDDLLLADIHRHFLGHGMTAPEEERWYWSGLIFEPNVRGASEVRRLWLQALDL